MWRAIFLLLLALLSVAVKPCNAQSPSDDQRPVVTLNVGHSAGALSVALSPDSRHVLSGGWDNTLKLWDTATGRLVHTFEGHWDMVRSVAFSPDGRHVLSGSADNTLKLWETATGQLVRTFQGHTKWVDSVAFSFDGRHVLSGSWDDTARLWDTATGRLVRTFAGHESVVTSVAVSPDGRQVITASLDNTLKLWSAATGRVLRTFRGHSDTVRSLMLSADGRRVLSGSHDKTVKLWDLVSGRLIRTFEGHSQRVISVALSPDGLYVLSGSDDKTLKLWDASTGQLLKTFLGHEGEVRSVTFSPDGRQVLSASLDGTIRLWDAVTAQLVRTFEGRSVLVSSAAFSPDSRLMLLGRWDKTLQLWNTATGRFVRTFKGHAEAIASVAFSPDGRHILSGSKDKALKLWDAATGEVVRTFEGHSDTVLSVAFSSDGLRVLSGSKDKSLKLWNSATGQLVRTFEGHSDWVPSVAFSPDGRHVLSGGYDKTLRLWEASTGRLVRTFVRGRSGRVGTVAFSPDGRHVLSGSSDNTLKLWEAASGQLVRTFEGHSNMVKSVAFSSDGRQILSGGWDGTLKIWDAATGQPLRTLEGPLALVNSVAISPDGRLALSASSDGTVRLWDMTAGGLLATLVGGRQGEWLTLTPEGYIDASSQKAGEMLSIVRGLEVQGIDQIFDALYRPDLVREKLAGDPHGHVRTAAAKLDLGKVLASGRAPQVLITFPVAGSTLEGDELKAEADIVDQGGGVGRIEWKVNGVTQGDTGQRGLGRVDLRSDATKISQLLALEPGENTIDLTVYNAANLIASTPATLRVVLGGTAAMTPPKLYVLTAGINDYLDSRMRLTYAVADATQIAKALREAGTGHYESVEPTILTDDQVTVDGLDMAFADLSKRVRPRDVLVFYAAGHGKTVDGRYYYLPRDFRYQTEASISEKGIGQDKWQAWFAKIAARKSILIYDTCESGTLTTVTAQQSAIRSGLEHQAALGRLINATGRTVLTASTSDRPALEGYQGHGVFTYALLDGLSRSDRNGNGLIEVTELAGFIDETVPQITEKAFGLRQFPQMSLQGSDFALGRRLQDVPGPSHAVPEPATAGVSDKPTHVVVEQAKVFEMAGGRGAVVDELPPYTAVAIIRSADGWSLIARDGKKIGYVEDAMLKGLQ